MASNFPTSLDTSSEQPSPSSTTDLDAAGFEHDVVHANHSTALIAVETKLGIGAAAATGASSGEVLTADGSGGSSWAAAGGSVTTSDTAPGSPSNGDLWYESDTGDLFVFTDSVWVEVGHATDGGTALADADGDTMIQVEEGADDDTIRFDTAGTERMTIGSTGNVGIGTTTPASSLHVTNYTDITPDANSIGHIQITGNGYSGCLALDTSGMWMSQNSTARSLIFATDETERMRIDGAGRVTTISQPSFHAYFNTYWTVTTSSTVLVFGSTAYNTGSHYSGSTGRFTAPVAGKYLFTFHAFLYTSYDNDTNSYFGFSKNGSGWATTNHGVEGQDGGQSISAVIELAANDYVSVWLSTGSISGAGGQYNSFTGHLLG